MFLNLTGAAPCPVPMTCWGWPFPQLGVPHSVQLFLLQTASHEFQNSGVIPEYPGPLTISPRLPFLILYPFSQLNWKLYLFWSILQPLLLFSPTLDAVSRDIR